MFDTLPAHDVESGMIVSLDNNDTDTDDVAWFHVERVSFDRDECAFMMHLRPLYMGNGALWICDEVSIDDNVMVRYDRDAFGLDD